MGILDFFKRLRQQPRKKTNTSTTPSKDASANPAGMSIDKITLEEAWFEQRLEEYLKSHPQKQEMEARKILESLCIDITCAENAERLVEKKRRDTTIIAEENEKNT